MGKKSSYNMAPKSLQAHRGFSLDQTIYTRMYTEWNNQRSHKQYNSKTGGSDNIIRVSDLPRFVSKAPEPVSERLRELKSEVSGRSLLTIEDYFQSNHFEFQEEKQESSLKLLRNSIELINSGRPLIAMDCEQYEREPLAVTEIGIAIMENYGEKVPEIKTFHVVVLEHINKRNSRYVPDKKDFFMGGTSLVMSKNDSRRFLQGIIQKYIEEKDGILICHQVSSELKYFRKIGLTYPHNIKTLDTLNLNQISRLGGNSLWATLRMLGIPYAYLHNAGNDAYYTLLAALALCDPVTRVKKNLDIYSESPYRGKKGSHKDNAEYLVVDDVALLLKDL